MLIGVQILIVLLELCLFVVALFPLGLMLSWVISGEMDVPFVPTPRRVFPQIFDALQYKAGDIVYELGSGDGRFILASAARAPCARFIGIEYNPILHVYALLRKRFAGAPKNVTFRRENFYKTDVSEATKIYAYLLPSVMDALLSKFEHELRNTRVASRAFRFSNKEPSQIIELSKKPGSHGEHLLYIYDF